MSQNKNILKTITRRKEKQSFIVIYLIFLDDKKSYFINKLNQFIKKNYYVLSKKKLIFFNSFFAVLRFLTANSSTVESIFLFSLFNSCQINFLQKCCCQDNTKLGIK